MFHWSRLLQKDAAFVLLQKKYMAQFHSLKIQTITRETDKSVSIAFGIPENLKETFTFKAGQYVTIKTKMNGEEIRRAYSLCSTPQSGLLKVAVKEVESGTFSKFANRDLKEGDTMEVHPPEGKFIFDESAFAKANTSTFAAFAAGSCRRHVGNVCQDGDGTAALKHKRKKGERKNVK